MMRIHKSLRKDSYYRTTLKEHGKTCDELDKAGLNKKQKRAYGTTSYGLGLKHGIMPCIFGFNMTTNTPARSTPK